MVGHLRLEEKGTGDARRWSFHLNSLAVPSCCILFGSVLFDEGAHLFTHGGFQDVEIFQIEFSNRNNKIQHQGGLDAMGQASLETWMTGAKHAGAF